MDEYQLLQNISVTGEELRLVWVDREGNGRRIRARKWDSHSEDKSTKYLCNDTEAKLSFFS